MLGMLREVVVLVLQVPSFGGVVVVSGAAHQVVWVVLLSSLIILMNFLLYVVKATLFNF